METIPSKIQKAIQIRSSQQSVCGAIIRGKPDMYRNETQRSSQVLQRDSMPCNNVSWQKSDPDKAIVNAMKIPVSLLNKIFLKRLILELTTHLLILNNSSLPRPIS